MRSTACWWLVARPSCGFVDLAPGAGLVEDAGVAPGVEVRNAPQDYAADVD